MRVFKRCLALLFASFFCASAEEIYASFDVYALHQSKLSFELAGIIKEIKAEAGSLVKKGDLLMSLENSSELIGLKNAKAQLELAKVSFENASSKMDKFKQIQGVIDAQSFENIEALYKEASLKLEQARLNVAKFEDILDKKLLKAPFDAKVGARFVELGEGVAPISQPVIELFSYPQVRLVLSFDEKYKARVKVGQSFKFKLEGKQLEGKIKLIYPNIDPKSRKVFAEVHLSELTPGLFGQGIIIAE